MKLATYFRCLTKVQKVPIVLIAALMAMGVPIQASAQSCGGSISGSVDPAEVLVPDLPTAAVITLLAQVGGISAPLTTDALTVGLTCADNGAGPGLNVPCNDDDLQDGDATKTPITFTNYITPDANGNTEYSTNPGIPACGVTTAVTSDNDVVDSVLTFNMPAQIVTTTGCLIKYNAMIEDIGTDNNPETLTQIFNVTGQCGPDTPGAAQGSLTINLDDPICVPETQVCVAVDTDHDGSFDDETCGPAMIGLNSTGGPGNTVQDGPKDFAYYVTGNKADVTDSEDLGACQVQQCVPSSSWNGTTCSGAWTNVTGEFTLDSTTPGPLFDNSAAPDSCSPAGDIQAFRIQCDTCDTFDIPRTTDPVDASVECADCDVRIHKEVSCDDKVSWGESCTGWDGDSESWFRYTVTNAPENGSAGSKAVDIDNCAVTDVDVDVLVPEGNYTGIGPIFPNGSATVIEWPNSICEDGEGSVNGAVDCACETTRNGAALVINGHVVGPNDEAARTFIEQNTTDTDPATLMCESAGLNVHKVCDDQDACGGSNDVTITISNADPDCDGTPGGDPVACQADLTACVVTDALLTSGPVCVDKGNADQVLSAGFGIYGSGGGTGSATMAVGPVECTGAVAGLTTDTLNEVSVTCEVETTGKTKTDTHSNMCVTTPCEGCLTRTPGFWGTHPHITTLFLPLEVCGITIDTVAAATPNSATENMCSVGKDSKTVGTSNQQAQLERQCMAAALNGAASVFGGGSCSEFATRFGQCCGATGVTDLCTSGASGKTISESGCIEDIDEFNNSLDTIEWSSPPANPFISPGPADSSICRASKNNGYMNPMPRGSRD